jgi:acyl carrier protein
METTFDTIRRLAVDTLDVPEVALLRARTLREAGVDSLATLDLLCAIEAHYGIQISAEDLADLHSLRDFAALVERLIARQTWHYEPAHEAPHEA